MTCVHKVRWSVKRPEDCRFRLSVSHYKDRIVAPDEYTGATEVTPSDQTQVLQTKDRLVRDDITVGGITGTQVITQNGTYDVLGDKSVVVNVPAPTGSVTITENGTYDVSEYEQAVVDTDIEWDGVLYPVTDESDQYYADHVFNTKYIPKLYAGDTVIIEVLGRGYIFSFRGGQPTSGYLQDYSVGNRTSGNTLMRFMLNITEDTKNFILGGYQWSANGSHSGYDYYCGYGEYLKWKVIHAT